MIVKVILQPMLTSYLEFAGNNFKVQLRPKM
uniref:Uncharacterized protein n=1 Tax=Arundo donax TaxID=35708 RepID=A0A0A8YHJ3_ARUDO